MKVLLAPFQYISSLPSKGVTNAMIDGLDFWTKVPKDSLEVIKKVATLLHNSALM